MKKVIALALTLAMVLALGVTAFAAPAITGLAAEYELGETEYFEITGLADKDVVTSVSSVTADLITFGEPNKVDGTGNWIVSAKMEKVGVTKIAVAYTNADSDEVVEVIDVAIEIVEAADEPQAGTSWLTLEEAKDMVVAGSVIALDVTGKDGITAELYNAVAKLNPEVIELYTDAYSIRLYRGDYTKLTVKNNVKINTMVKVIDTLTLKGKDANNRVLTALGNKNADPFYVTIDSTNLTEIAANPELTVVLDTPAFAAWCKTNNCKAMDIYAFDASDDTVALVKENVSVNNLFDNEVEMPTLESAIYVFVDADNSATGSANVKPNTNTGANDMVAVAVVFATIALAAGVSKKVR